MRLSFHDQDLFAQADRANVQTPEPIPAWIGELTHEEWQLVLAAADARDEREFWKGGR